MYTRGPKASNACSHIPQSVSSAVRQGLVPPEREQLRALFIKRWFPHRLRGFKISNQLKGLPLKYGVFATFHEVLRKIS